MATPKEDEVKDTGVPTNDAYTGMLVISLLALVAGAILLYLDMSQYPTAPQPKTLPEYKKAEKAPVVVPPAPDDKKGPAIAPPAKDAPPMPEAKKDA